MRYLQLRLHLPSEVRHPMHQFLSEQELIRRAYLRHWNFSDPSAVTTLFHVVGDVAEGSDEYIDALDAVDTIVEYDITPVDDRSFYVYVTEATNGIARELRTLLTDTDLLVVPPIVYGPDGEMQLEIAGHDSELQALVAGLPSHVSVSVDRLGEYDAHRESSVAALTERQREVVSVAREIGYYDVPRNAGVRDVADRLDCSKSTAANHLRKAEARLVALYGVGNAT
ncbi:helix-turn-helix domain-containing protein [Halogeometricum borinquense]|uniref:helix-turn-helix domain-containing protein n=1 Tax=Halogeometricum borinquense TaxID=60847 RepID=UPI00343863C3